MNRLVLYVAHPLAPTEEMVRAGTLKADGSDRAAAVRTGLRLNLERAMRWLAWLRRTFPETTFIAPWIASILAGEDDSDPAQREAGLVDAVAVIRLVHGVVFCGGRISTGMQREGLAAMRTWDLTELGAEPPAEPPHGYRAGFVATFRARRSGFPPGPDV